MNLYDKYVVPWITHFVCASRQVTRRRQKVVPEASGRVLEIGFGSGLNLPWYDPEQVEQVFGLEPSQEMWRHAEPQIANSQVKVEPLLGSAEAVPLDTDTMDAVVSTFTMCSIPDLELALHEMRRVLRPGGVLLFCEHGAAPEPIVRKWQDRLNPLWKKLAGGCHLNRDIPQLLKLNGFRLERLDAAYMNGFRPGSYNFWGLAKPG